MNPHLETMQRITPWETLSSEIVLDNRWLRIRADRCRTPGGTIVDPYFVAEHPDWVHVLAFNREMEVLVLYQYRQGVKKVGPELVAGIVDDGEDPLTTAARELREETGCTAGRIEKVGSYHAIPGNMDNTLHCYVAFDVERTTQTEFGPGEFIEHEFVPLDRLATMIDDGTWTSALSNHSLLVGLRHAGISLPPKV